MGHLAAAVVGITTALGPSEVMMLTTGAVIVPSSSSLLFLALTGILAAGTCGAGAVVAPTVVWAYNQSGAIGDSVKLSGRICRILGSEPPVGFTYELFLDEQAQKISKSKGNGTATVVSRSW